MKLLLTSPDAIFDSEGNFFDGIYDALIHWTKLEADNNVAVVSMRKERLATVPDEFLCLHIKGEYRGSTQLIEIIKEELKIETTDIIVLGAKLKDVQTAANSKLILLNALYAQENNPDDVIYEREYGIPISDASALKKFFNVFISINLPWYYKLEVDANTAIYSLTNANTMGNVSQDKARLNQEFRDCLKDGDDTYRTQFMIYFLISTYQIFKEFQDIKYWGIYPSSGTGPNPDLDFFLTKARQSYKSIQKEPLLIRTKKANKRHESSPGTRITDGCDSQFASMIVNPYYLKGGKLKGANVCIIDDFTTYGSSCETARILLQNAGVNKVLFITMGKFGKAYNRYEYKIIGDVFTGYTFKQIGRTPMVGTFNTHNSDRAFLESLTGIK